MYGNSKAENANRHPYCCQRQRRTLQFAFILSQEMRHSHHYQQRLPLRSDQKHRSGLPARFVLFTMFPVRQIGHHLQRLFLLPEANGPESDHLRAKLPAAGISENDAPYHFSERNPLYFKPFPARIVACLPLEHKKNEGGIVKLPPSPFPTVSPPFEAVISAGCSIPATPSWLAHNFSSASSDPQCHRLLQRLYLLPYPTDLHCIDLL
ncbi:MAG: hypothetical protein MUF29_03760 [Chitinophagaceae bacterium]|jgi:hypothetical protein|nr:hypothetical protein [Chitinophagaceae bacterium]